MLIECEVDPNSLIAQIGDLFYSVCGENVDEAWRHANHPITIRLMDCEGDNYIDVTGCSSADTDSMAEALCRLLNQDYKKV